MASSSVSQESLDMDDFDTAARRNRIRTHRGRAMPHRSGEREGTGDVHDGRERDHQNGDTGDSALGIGDHESPTRSAAARIKDKQRSRANHTHKGKPGPKDKRKLREKRRSTGVVHLPSTESTGDSLDDDDDEENNLNHETKKNTTFNESTTSHSHTHLHHGHAHHNFEGRHSSSNFSQRGNKSPSDLEADLEDNQDYDSTVSHSETNLTLIGRSESSDTQMSSGLMSRQPPSAHAKFSPEASRASSGYRYGSSAQAASGDPESKPPPVPAATKSSVASLVSRYSQERDPPPPSSLQRDSESGGREGGVARPSGMGAHKDSASGRSERGLGTHLTSRFQERERESSGMGSNSSGSSAGGSYQSSRYQFQAPRPFLGQHSASLDNSSQLERQLEREKEENRRLQQQLEQKDHRIAELEHQVAMLNRRA
ncbi:uncharacterized protein LOC143298280 isoform X2 [Babylonia areolata]|uniref:uncharacterized protein LOC143298280 isoform X2 n=1 Tax=Babylonia areolata TaxID=304850 RepID=UPI003FD53072